jgi:hypothetical protein
MTFSGDGTITGLTAGGLPNATVQQADLATNVAGNGPAFSAYSSGNQNITTSTWTKAVIGFEYFDTNSNYDKDTNYRFQPTVAGYYQLNGATFLQSASSNVTFSAIAIYKNGTGFSYGSYGVIPANGAVGAVVSDLIYFNGSSDYIELYIYATATSPFATTIRLSGSLVRAA